MTLGFFKALVKIRHIKRNGAALSTTPLICCDITRTYPLEGCSPAEPSSVSARVAKIRFLTYLCLSYLSFFDLLHQPFLATLPKQVRENHALAAILRRERDSNPWNAKRSTVFETAPIDHSGISPDLLVRWSDKTKATISRPCGDRGIRTPEAFRLNGFQDRRYRPLSHISAAKVRQFSIGCEISRKKIPICRESIIFAT